MISQAIVKLSQKESLGTEESFNIMDEIMSGKATSVQTASYLTALSMKGESIEEITGSALAMRKHSNKVPYNKDLLEIVGTGGDFSSSFNISTCSALVLASAGVKVAKHGNRSATSACGSADVLEALGVNIDLAPERSLELLEKIGICFMFAQKYHSAMKYVAPIRKELNIRTIFNILGPLTNPAKANRQLLGVYKEELVEPMAQTLSKLGVKRAIVAYGRDGLDEISLSDETFICEVSEGEFKSYTLTPEECGLKRCHKSELVGGDCQQNAQIIREIVSGKQSAKSEAVVLNSAAALTLTKDISLKEAVKEIKELLFSGKVAQKLEDFISYSHC